MTTQTTTTTAWPEGVIARYLTVAGQALAEPTATVDVIDLGDDSYWRYDTKCASCGRKDGFRDGSESSAHRDAQAHAEKCRALPKP